MSTCSWRLAGVPLSTSLRLPDAQVADQRTGLGAQQQVLGAALDADDALSGQAHVQVFGNRPAQAPLAHDHALDALAFEVGGDAPAGGFDFG